MVSNTIKVNFEIPYQYKNGTAMEIMQLVYKKLNEIYNNKKEIFESDENKIVNSSLKCFTYEKENWDDEIYRFINSCLAVTIQSRAQSNCGIHNCNNMCYCQPKHKYYCSNCKSKPWLSHENSKNYEWD